MESNERNRLIDEAVQHIAALHEDQTGVAHERFASWVYGSKPRVEAYLIATAQLRELTRLDAMAETVAACEPPANDDSVRPRSSVRRAAFGALGALAASVVLVFAWYGSARRVPEAAQDVNVTHYDTAGTFDLGNGSMMQLREQSHARKRVIAGGSGTEVTLLDGEALFTGHHDEAHPLHVLAGRLVLAVVGTDFDVLQRDAESQVTVISGAVQVSSVCRSQRTTPLPAPVRLVDHQMAVVDNHDCSSPLIKALTPDESVDQAAWTGQWRSFSGIRIGMAVKLFNDNNHNSVHLIVQDPELANRRIGGRFRVTDPEAFIDVLTQAFGARADRSITRDGSTVIYLRSGSGT